MRENRSVHSGVRPARRGFLTGTAGLMGVLALALGATAVMHAPAPQGTVQADVGWNSAKPGVSS
ncbi:hypothetical protein FHS39_003234 [Streptomyces olivoverticillatus]|uniref:Uncharacterized protein n=1 Tax=Streptomyces olivoverticillatus TaxID=66427 RepID=A0A7W7PMW1_9ACTN|nr:hypothetical protein [Streptomyces olivoverticillatus]